jgi:starch phosphorylase
MRSLVQDCWCLFTEERSFTLVCAFVGCTESVIPSVANPTSRDAAAIASNIKYHAEYTPSYSPYKFELEQAYVATAESLRDTLVQRWNETYKHFQLDNAKAIHYLSMEFLQVC